MSLAYVDRHPADAARVLGHLTPEDATAFLAVLPKRLGAPLLTHLLPTFAARCIELLDGVDAAGLLRELDVQSVTAILRYLNESTSAKIIEQLPTTTAVALRMLLAYPEDTAGAWINPGSISIDNDATIGEALDRMRRSRESGAPYVYVVDESHRLLGIARVADLLRASRNARVGQIARSTRHNVSARSSLTAALEHVGWREFHALPVIERSGRFLGALEYPTLRRALEHARALDNRRGQSRGVGLVARSSWSMFAALLHALISLIPVQRPASSSTRDGH